MALQAEPPRGQEFLAAVSARLRAYLHMMLGNRDDADDVVQDALVKFLRKGPPAGSPPAEAWLFQTARREALNLMRGESRRRRRESSRDSGATGGDPLESALRNEAIGRIGDCLSRLPAEVRELLYLQAVESRSYSELAALLDMPRSTVALRVQEGLVLLNRCFHGGAP